jgi:outer membrane protein TolC
VLAAISTVACALFSDRRTSAVAAEPGAIPSVSAPPSEPLTIAGAGPSRAMTLDEALSFARAHQPALRSALARVAAAAADTRIARAQWLPGLGITAQAFEGTANNTTASYIGAPRVDLPRIGGTRVASTGTWAPSTSMLAAAGLGQEVFDFGRIAAQAAVADTAYEGERFRADSERLRIDLLVRETYFGVQGARAVLRAAEDAYRRARVHRDMAAAVVKSGLHEPIELTRAEADLTRFDVGRIRAVGSLRTAQAAFAAAVGVEERLLDAAGQSPPTAAVPPLELGLRQAADHDPLLQEARSRVRFADTLTRAIGAEMRPDVALTATFSGRAGTASPSSGSVSDNYGPLPLVPNWDVGLILRWPLYDPVVAARRDAAASRTAVARADVSVLSQQETAAIQQAYVSFEVNQAAVVSLQQAVDAARANYAQAEARFKAGLGTSLELADAEALRTDAEIQLAVGQFEALRGRAVIGRLIAEGM